MNAQPRPDPGASIRTVAARAPRTRCASATPPMLPSLPTTSGTARPARCWSARVIGSVHVESGEAGMQVRRVAEDAVALVRTGDREADAAELIPLRARCRRDSRRWPLPRWRRSPPAPHRSSWAAAAAASTRWCRRPTPRRPWRSSPRRPCRCTRRARGSHPPSLLSTHTRRPGVLSEPRRSRSSRAGRRRPC